MASTLNCLLKLSLALAVCVACTAALPPRLFARAGHHEESRQDVPMDCSPRPDGSTPHGCADTVAGNGISYETPDVGGVLELVDGLEDGVRVVEDEKAGTFVIRVPRYQPLHRRGCPYRHVFIAELGMCVKERNYPRFIFRYPSLAGRFV